jgi:uncharacterized phage protein (TIGR01671 family)
MSREIKFRAWDGSGMLIPDFVTKEGKAAYWGNCRVREPRNNILMQFTGRHDYHGKEVYEGDVLHDEEGNTPVEWSTEMLAWKVTDSDGCAFMLADCNMALMEIIGNIYENADLLQ